MNRFSCLVSAAAMAALVGPVASSQINNATPAPGGNARRGGASVEASVVSAARSPEVNADNSITFRLLAPNARSVRVITDIPKFGDQPHGSTGFDLTKDEQGVWSYTTPSLKPSY